MIKNDSEPDPDVDSVGHPLDCRLIITRLEGSTKSNMSVALNQGSTDMKRSSDSEQTYDDQKINN